MAVIKKAHQMLAGCRERGPRDSWGGMEPSAATVEISMAPPQKTRNGTVTWPSNTIPVHALKGSKVSTQQRRLHAMFAAALLTTAKSWSQLRFLSTDECIRQKWHSDTMSIYSAIKNEIMTFAGKWMELEIITWR
jgi:hypothetical protein